MCGISALIRIEPGDLQPITKMNDLIAHRGPDDQNVKYFNQRVALGHRRLSILDLSSAGQQPMADSTHRFWITYNGEVYNYQEIRSKLQKKGHTFHSQTDTEVILAAYQEWGVDCLKHFNGMFAFVIYDQQQQTIFAARDRFGVKPLYYCMIDGVFAFGSEIKQFTALPGWKFSQNEQRVYDFINWGVLDHTSETMFSGVHQVSGGHYFLFPIDALKDRVLKPQKWYDLPVKEFNGTFDEASTIYKDLLFDSIRLRLHADVDVGSCLSGGLDSSAIVCAAHQLLKDSKETLKTFTAGSEHAQYDERAFVNAVINQTGVDSHVVIPQSDRLFDHLSTLVWHQDEPFVSTSIFAQWEIFSLIKKNQIKVVLDGQGADECLGGYHGFFANYGYDLFKNLKWSNLISEWQAVKKMHPKVSYEMMLLNKLVPEAIRQPIRRLLGKSSSVSEWIDLTKLKAISQVPFDPQHPFYQQSRQQLLCSSVPMLLHFEDRNSMAHSIESRTPFLDYRLVEFILGCPTEYKMNKGVTKRILRTAMDGILPEQINRRYDKMGFLTAEEIWFKKESPKRLLDGVQTAIDLSEGILKQNILTHTQEMLQGKRPFNYMYWRVLCYGAWLKVQQ